MSWVECASCGISFGLPEIYEKNRRRDHAGFWCPNGHSQSFQGESEAERYKRLMEAAQSQANLYRQSVEAAQRARDLAEKNLRRLKKRTAAGVCPCCSRTVSQLARHMQSKHQEFLALNGMTPPKALPPHLEKTA